MGKQSTGGGGRSRCGRRVTRRDFLQLAGGGAAAAVAAGWARGLPAADTQPSKPSNRPNILWIMAEDISPELACYGTGLIRTPNLDALAAQGARYTQAFTTAPVCSPSRSAMITGMYQTTIGAHHHRSHRNDGYTLPAPVKPITDYLRQAGYYTCNVRPAAPGVCGSGKTDFNFQAKGAFDGDDWARRKGGQPFFAQLSLADSHRGRGWPRARKVLEYKVDPDKVKLPPYYPDHAIARDDWANYLDAIMLVDGDVGKILKRLDDEGIADHTVVIFIGDNGRCHVRGKQWLYEGGIHIPLIIRWPGVVPRGVVCDDLLVAIDISAQVLKIAGVEPPRYMEGRPFLGPVAKKRDFIIAARDRCDETVDRIRCVRTKRFKYIRNYMPDRPYTQPNAYKERQYPVLRLMKQLHAEGKLTEAQELFMAPKRPPEELYDLQADPWEIHNLAASPEHSETLKQLRGILEQWIKDTGDKGQFPEEEAGDSPGARSSRGNPRR